MSFRAKREILVSTKGTTPWTGEVELRREQQPRDLIKIPHFVRDAYGEFLLLVEMTEFVISFPLQAAPAVASKIAIHVHP